MACFTERRWLGLASHTTKVVPRATVAVCELARG